LLAEVAIELGNKAALPPSFRQHMTAAQASLKKEPLPEAEIMKALVAAYRSVSADQPFKVSEEVRAKGALPFTLDLVASVRRQARQAACDGCAKRLVEAMLLILTPIETGVAGPAQESEAAARTVVRW
jgi:hypothetical protein